MAKKTHKENNNTRKEQKKRKELGRDSKESQVKTFWKPP